MSLAVNGVFFRNKEDMNSYFPTSPGLTQYTEPMHLHNIVRIGSMSMVRLQAVARGVQSHVRIKSSKHCRSVVLESILLQILTSVRILDWHGLASKEMTRLSSPH
jgi:hypothetical protein